MAPISSARPEEIYAEQLGLRRSGYYGYPLWEARPVEGGLPADIGDVGYVEEGSWIRLFNMFKPDGPPANLYGFPQGLNYPLQDRIGPVKPRTLPAKEPIYSINVSTSYVKLGADGGQMYVLFAIHIVCNTHF